MADLIAIDYAEVLPRLRRERGVSQVELAEAIGCSRSTVQRLENGEGVSSAAVRMLLARWIGRR